MNTVEKSYILSKVFRFLKQRKEKLNTLEELSQEQE